MADKKRKRKTKKMVASVSGYNYIDVEHAMLDLRSLVTKLTGKKSDTDLLKRSTIVRNLYEEDICEILLHVKGFV